MPKIRLTEFSVKNAKPLATQYMLWDATLPNFGVRVSPGGTKNFTAMLGARQERVSIGRFPIISLAEARVKAKALMAERTLGQHQAKTIKFEEAYELFKSQHCARKTARTSYDYTRIIDVHFLSKLRHERLEEITYETVAKITDKLIDTPAEQAHAQGVARTFFRWAVRRRYLKHSPLEGMQIAKSAIRDRVLDDRELVAVYRAAQDIGYPFGTIVQLLILTGQRRNEIAALQRTWIDFDQQTITLPGAMTKNGRQHTLPFGHTTKRVLDDCPTSTAYNSPRAGHPANHFPAGAEAKKCLMLSSKTWRPGPFTIFAARSARVMPPSAHHRTSPSVFSIKNFKPRSNISFLRARGLGSNPDHFCLSKSLALPVLMPTFVRC